MSTSLRRLAAKSAAATVLAAGLVIGASGTASAAEVRIYQVDFQCVAIGVDDAGGFMPWWNIF